MNVKKLIATQSEQKPYMFPKFYSTKATLKGNQSLKAETESANKKSASKVNISLVQF